jgi:hypothetical protein
LKKYLLTAALVLAVAPASTAEARQPQSKFEAKIVHLRKKVDKKFGPHAAGRDVIKQGARNGGRPPMKLKVRYRDNLREMLAPPVVVSPIQAPPSAAVSQPTTSYSGSGGSGCNGMSAESGSSGYNNTSHPGYIGCYQISQDHYSPSGSCHGLGTDPAGQDACAQIICNTEGAGAWTNPQGQNPCNKP